MAVVAGAVAGCNGALLLGVIGLLLWWLLRVGVGLLCRRGSGVSSLPLGLIGHVGHIKLPICIGVIGHRHLVVPKRGKITTLCFKLL